MENISFRDKVLAVAKKQYQSKPESLWAKYPEDVVLRHTDNQKWYALLMKVSRDKLGLDGDEKIDILDIKTEPAMLSSFQLEEGILPGYHMNKKSWITVLLDGTVPMKTIELLLDISYEMTSSKKTKKSGIRNTEWIVPANPKFYDIDAGLKESGDGTLLWKQSNSICVGDEIYIYVGAPISAIKYRCKAIEVDIPFQYTDENMQMSKAMRLRLLQRYEKTPIDFAMLKENGVYAVRGPRGIPNSLKYKMAELYPEK